MNDLFDLDPFPGNPKILFIGPGASTRTHAWIDLLSNAKFNVRLFSVPGGGAPPLDWKIRTHICDPSSQLPRGLNPGYCQSFYPFPEEAEALLKVLRRRISFKFFLVVRKMLNYIGTLLRMPILYFDYSRYGDLWIRHFKNIGATAPDKWLAEIIENWRPDVIHTLGLFDGQGGTFYFDARKRFGLQKMGTWVIQLCGGSDTALRRYSPETTKQILDIFTECDQIITDNYSTIEYIEKLGFAGKIASIAPVPGIGGIDVDTNVRNLVLPSARQRVIFWPRAYESMWLKAVPVIEAIKLAWDQIKPCTIYITAINNETESWLATLPKEIKKNCRISFRVPRDQVLEMMKQARVMLSPSLVDGVPNVLYEAMANGAFPIVSPLETIMPFVSEPHSVLFARNLYAQEIAGAIVKAMTDDRLIDEAAINNLKLVEKLASRKKISKKAVDYYFRLFEFDRIEGQAPLISVIIPFYNRIPWVLEAVKSVLNQTYQNFEIILVNDGSTESLDALLEVDDPRIKIVHQSNKGPASARNHGMRNAQGEYIAFLDSDDRMEPTKLMYQLNTHLKNPDVWLTHTSYRYIGYDEPATLLRSGRFSGSVYPDVYFGCPIASSTVMFKREVIERNIFMEEKYKISEDIIFFGQIARHSRIIGIDIPLTLFRRTQSTHALSPRAQITGSTNIIHYLRNSNNDLTDSQKRMVFSRIFRYIGYNYKLLKKPFRAYYYYLQAFLYLENKASLFKESLFSRIQLWQRIWLKWMRELNETEAR